MSRIKVLSDDTNCNYICNFDEEHTSYLKNLLLKEYNEYANDIYYGIMYVITGNDIYLFYNEE